MRVSTAALQTLLALVAQDIASQAVAAPPSLPAPLPEPTSASTPAHKGLTASELVAPIAPAETLPMQLSTTDKISVEAPAPVVSPQEAENPSTATLTPTLSLTQPTPQASSQPGSQANSAPLFNASPTVTDAVTQTAAPQPTPLVQTLDEAAVLTPPGARQPRVSTQGSSVAVESLTLAEIKSLQQGLSPAANKATTVTNTGAPTANVPSTSAALISANLAEQAAAAFADNKTQTNPPATPNTNGQQPGSNSIPQDVNDGFSFSVYNPGDNARSYYNLTTRPVSQFSNGNVSILFPLSIPAAITSAFGWRVHPVMGGARFHAGTDIGAPQGTPVLAALDGKVEVADFVGGYGLAIVLQHSQGTEQTLYGHLSEIFVQPGDTIKQGEAIGRVGSTGLSTGPHLHFEFRKLTQEGWTLMDPGPSLEYALLHFDSSHQTIAQNVDLKLPTLFKYSGKFLEAMPIAAQPNAGNPQALTVNSNNTLRSAATRDRVVTHVRTRLTNNRSPQG